ncbi:MAG: Gfo/Idh/MocA family oxidoreductase [Clostridia bacterium]|nr:Gfo/Idh/MocA family oxidoreductase [Clostridia bacterium]
MRKYTIALLGCGQMGAEHLHFIYYRENVYIKYVCDTDIEKARLLQRKVAAGYAVCDADICISDEEVDIVIIATYPETHTALLKKCVSHGKHVLCEKPIANTLEEAKSFYEIAAAHPECKVLVGHILRHNLTYNKVAELIQSGTIGGPLVMRMVQNHHTMNWERYRALICQTSPIIDCGVHYFDIMQWMSGEKIVGVSGISQKLASDLPDGKYDYGMVTLRFSGGSIGYYEAGWTNTSSSENTKEFIGPKGRIKIVYAENRFTNREEGDLIEIYRFPERSYEIMNINCKRKPTDLQFDHLIRMIEENAPAKPTLEEALSCCEWTFRADKAICQ